MCDAEGVMGGCGCRKPLRDHYRSAGLTRSKNFQSDLYFALSAKKEASRDQYCNSGSACKRRRPCLSWAATGRVTFDCYHVPSLHRLIVWLRQSSTITPLGIPVMASENSEVPTIEDLTFDEASL